MKSIQDTYWMAVVRVTVGTVLLVAGFQKLGSAQSFAQEISNYRLLPEASIDLIAVTLPWFELLVGALLIVGLQTQVAALSASLLFLGFEVFIVSALVRGLNIDCGCFSGASAVSWVHAVVDLLLLASAGLLFFQGPGRLALDARFSRPANSRDRLSRVGVASGVVILTINLALLWAFGAPQGVRIQSGPASDVGSGATKIVFESSVVDLGEVQQQQKTRVTAIYRNIGMEEARILKVKTSCGCTAAAPEKTVLLPGESAKLEISYQPGANRGEFHQSVFLEVEDQEKPAFLSLQGQIIPFVVASPVLVELEPHRPVAITLTPSDPQRPFTVTGIATPVEQIQFRSSVGEGNRVVVELQAQAPIPSPPRGVDAWPLQLELSEGPPCLVYVRTKGLE